MAYAYGAGSEVAHQRACAGSGPSCDRNRGTGALVRDLYVESEVASGRLAVVLDQPWPTRFAYYAVTLPGAEENPAIAAFLRWLEDEIQAPTSAL